MNIRQISFNIAGAAMLAGVCTGCSDDSYMNKAKKDATQYINGYDLLKAERHERLQQADDRLSAKEVMYWDSLLIEAKSKEAYAKGQQLIKDSLNGNHYRKEKFIPKLDTIISGNLITNQRENVAKLMSAKEFIKYRDNAPQKDGLANEFPYRTHYWNLITLAGKQNEAYQKGMADERAKINK